MRAVLYVGPILVVLATFIAAQTANEKPNLDRAKPETEFAKAKGKPKVDAVEKAPASSTVRTTITQLQLEIRTKPLREEKRFKEVLEYITQELAANKREITILVDMAAFREEYTAEAPALLDGNVQIVTSRERASAFSLLKQAVSQLQLPAAVVVRGDRVEIVPAARTSKEYMLNQTFVADFKERRLDLALEELSDLTGVSIILDTRAKQKAQTGVTGRFLDDVALQDAVRMLTDMADLKIVYLVTGIYVTTPEHARDMQKELRDLYEPSQPGAGVGFSPSPMGGGGPRGPRGFGMPGSGGPPPGGAGPPPDPNYDPSQSPLAPPLPPARKKRGEAAAA